MVDSDAARGVPLLTPSVKVHPVQPKEDGFPNGGVHNPYNPGEDEEVEDDADNSGTEAQRVVRRRRCRLNASA